MPDSQIPRWRHRLENFGKALVRLEEACGQEDYTDLERAGLVQMFGMTFELAWKTLRDLLTSEGFAANTPREVIRLSFEAEFTNEADTETLVEALEKRNLLSHTYNEETAREAERLIKVHYAPVLRQVFDRLHAKGDR